MNKFILEELQKTKVNLPTYNNQTTELFIPKNNGLRSAVDIIVGHDYAVYIEDYILNLLVIQILKHANTDLIYHVVHFMKVI